jgi:hypothetical protein
MEECTMSIRGISRCTILMVAALAVGGCGQRDTSGVTGPDLPSDVELSRARPTLPPFDPGQFVEAVTNPYFPLMPGVTYTYLQHTKAGTESTVVEVLYDTRNIMGIDATVVRDRVYLDGELIEDTFDWYAQDTAGNVWYLGEDSKEYEGGEVVSTEGSWEAGQNGAEAGIIMLAEPQVGMTYAQERAPGVAEDMARVLSLDETVTVQSGTFTDVLLTLEWSAISHGKRELKYYAQGVGLVLETTRGGKEPTELVSVTGP